MTLTKYGVCACLAGNVWLGLVMISVLNRAEKHSQSLVRLESRVNDGYELMYKLERRVERIELTRPSANEDPRVEPLSEKLKAVETFVEGVRPWCVENGILRSDGRAAPKAGLF